MIGYYPQVRRLLRGIFMYPPTPPPHPPSVDISSCARFSALPRTHLLLIMDQMFHGAPCRYICMDIGIYSANLKLSTLNCTYLRHIITKIGLKEQLQRSSEEKTKPEYKLSSDYTFLKYVSCRNKKKQQVSLCYLRFFSLLCKTQRIIVIKY